MNMKQLISLFTLTLFAITATASDIEKEKRWADQVVDAILDGDAEWLNDGQNDFLAIYTEAESESKRGALILHGTGVHPDWQQVIQPLRVELTTVGWNTLSIQMPILHNEADYKEYAPLYPEIAPRMDAAIAFLKDNGVDEVVIIGHSQGATMAAYYLREPNATVKGLGVIGMAGSFGTEAQNGVKSLSSIKLPTLDLYGSDDLEYVLDSVDSRRKASASSAFTQKKVDGANHMFDDREAELVEVVSEWLKTL